MPCASHRENLIGHLAGRPVAADGNKTGKAAHPLALVGRGAAASRDDDGLDRLVARQLANSRSPRTWAAVRRERLRPSARRDLGLDAGANISGCVPGCAASSSSRGTSRPTSSVGCRVSPVQSRLRRGASEIRPRPARARGRRGAGRSGGRAAAAAGSRARRAGRARLGARPVEPACQSRAHPGGGGGGSSSDGERGAESRGRCRPPRAATPAPRTRRRPRARAAGTRRPRPRGQRPDADEPRGVRRRGRQDREPRVERQRVGGDDLCAEAVGECARRRPTCPTPSGRRGRGPGQAPAPAGCLKPCSSSSPERGRSNGRSSSGCAARHSLNQATARGMPSASGVAGSQPSSVRAFVDVGDVVGHLAEERRRDRDAGLDARARRRSARLRGRACCPGRRRG